MIWIAAKNNVYNNRYYYAGEEINEDKQPSEHWKLAPGQTMPEPEPPAEPPAEEPPVDPSKMKKEELIAFARLKGCEVTDEMTKDQILAAIAAKEAQ